MNGQVELAVAWMRKGDSDRAAARRIADGAGPYDTACFHAQQAAEKYLKAVLALSAQPIPRTHDLEVILQECRRSGMVLDLAVADLATLTPYAVQLRYDAEFWPDLATARDAVRISESVRAAVLTALPPGTMA
ncbi:MAG: HEPN domain-containing protein [Planctomycetes bacterium]|nr:HEPN domain-containing protein [Planctomycetota bacterium]